MINKLAEFFNVHKDATVIIPKPGLFTDTMIKNICDVLPKEVRLIWAEVIEPSVDEILSCLLEDGSYFRKAYPDEETFNAQYSRISKFLKEANVVEDDEPFSFKAIKDERLRKSSKNLLRKKNP